MSREEFLDRSRQEFSKRADAARARFGFEFVEEPSPSSARTGAFFFKNDQVESLLQLIRQRVPGEAERIIARAEKILIHRFDLLGYEDLNYGQAINWHLDLVHGKIAPKKPFYRVKYLDFEEVGDSKITWELNRHQHLVTLTKAYRLTGDERFLREIHLQWSEWHLANFYPLGINWASSLEVAFRSLSWIWMYFLLEGTPGLTPDFRRDWLQAQALNGRHLERYLSTYFSPNTHLLGEGVALFFIGTLCGELSGAARWKSMGWRIAVQEARRQVNPDGLHFEQSTYYHVYALDFFLHAAVLAMVNGEDVPKDFEEILKRMLNALFQLSLAGPPPQFGDDDGGRLFDPLRNRAEHLADPLAAGAILFQRADFKRLAGSLREETIWLLGESGVHEWDRIKAQDQKLGVVSSAFRSAGVYVLSVRRSQVMIRGGSALPQSYGHSHADALSVCLQSEGSQLLIDPGVAEYVGPGDDRNFFRGTAMHNTLRIDGKDQHEPAGPFSWKQPVLARTEQWIQGENFDLFAGAHDAYQRLPFPVKHRRWVIALKQAGIFLVRDLVEGRGKHRLSISWHIGPKVQLNERSLFRQTNAVSPKKLKLGILPCDGHDWVKKVNGGWYSPVYGRKRPAAVLTFEAERLVPAEFITLLIPFHEACEAPVTFTKLSSEETDKSVHAYRYKTRHREDRVFFRSRRNEWNYEDVTSDAEFLCLAGSADSEEPEIILCNGSYVALKGVRIVTLKRKVERYELTQGSAGEIFCSDMDAL